MNDILEKAKQQRKALTDEIEAKQRELAELDQFLRTYHRIQAAATLDMTMTEPSYRSAKDQILGNVERLLSDRRSCPTRELFTELEKLGIHVGGKSEKNKLLNLSSLLSRDERFKAGNRKTGWSLAKRSPKGEAGDGAPASVRH